MPEPDLALSVVIPVYNEGEPFVEMLRELDRALPRPFEVLVVYDMDEDTTVAPVKAYARERPEIRLEKNRHGRGASQAIRTGFEAARGEAVLVTMGDMSDDLTAVAAMMEAFRAGADVVCGSRYMPGGSQREGPLVKRTLSRLAGMSLYLIGALPVRDATNSFKLYRRSLLGKLRIESDTGFTIGIEIVVKAHLMGARVVEVPASYRERTTGKSRFRVARWLPAYLRWYLLALRGRLALLALCLLLALPSCRKREAPDILLVVLDTVRADHGEYLGEHGRLGHGRTLHPEVLKVPLVIEAPGLIPPGRRVSEPVQLQDIYGTLLELAGIEDAPFSLVDAVQGASRPGAIQAASRLDPRWAKITAGRSDAGFRYYREGSVAVLLDGSGHGSVFDLRADPPMSRPIEASHPLVARAREAFPSTTMATPVTEEQRKAMREALEALGYLDR